jgi:inner membrane transporter RhtA
MLEQPTATAVEAMSAGRDTAQASALARVPAPGLVVTGIVSVQFGAAIAITVFNRAGASGVVLLRLVFASLILLAVARPRVREMTNRQRWLAAGFGVVLGVMNIAFYASIARIPLGIAVAIEFLGPLGVAIAGSRRRVDFAWVALAAIGVLALSRGDAHALNLLGVLLALLAGTAWAIYILWNARMGQAFSDRSGLTFAMCVAAVIALPFGIGAGGTHLLESHVLLIGAAVGLLSSAIPYSLEMEALRRITPAVFGVLMSLEPAFAALAGFLIVGQGLSLRELVGIAMVILASAGASSEARGDVAVAADIG